MFPLAHNLMVNTILSRFVGGQTAVSALELRLLRVGAIIPDLVAGMGMDRNFGHRMGEELYGFCAEHHPESRAFALGAWLHGIDPCGFDHYADEHWQGGKGWCFQVCEPYVPDVIEACALPPIWGQWKAHNFVEMMAELEVARLEPQLGAEVLAAKDDPTVRRLVTEVLVDFGGVEAERVGSTLDKVGRVFAFVDVDAEQLGEKYACQMLDRHGIEGADGSKNAAILLRMQKELAASFRLWYDEVTDLMTTALAAKRTLLTP